jgi:hypothetical protein
MTATRESPRSMTRLLRTNHHSPSVLSSAPYLPFLTLILCPRPSTPILSVLRPTPSETRQAEPWPSPRGSHLSVPACLLTRPSSIPISKLQQPFQFAGLQRRLQFHIHHRFLQIRRAQELPRILTIRYTIAKSRQAWNLPLISSFSLPRIQPLAGIARLSVAEVPRIGITPLFSPQTP